MDVGFVTAIMFGSMLLLLATGFPIGFTLFGLGAIFTLLLWGPQSLPMLASALLSQSTTVVLLAIPMFLFMGYVLERSGLAEELFTTIYHWMGGIPGGLAIGTVIICTIFAAMSGISGTACVSMGLIALPAMLKRKYDQGLAVGCIAGGAGLGVLIPPSVIMVVYGQLAGESVGKLFMSGILPGLMISGVFQIYIAVRALLNPKLAPPLPREERAGWGVKVSSLIHLSIPIGLVILVLGAIFTGAATPTEASAVGALGSIGCAAIYRKLNWQIVKEASYGTLRVSAMIMWITVGAYAFSSVYQAMGAVNLITEIVKALPVDRYIILAGMMFILLIMGCFLDPIGILMITGPVFIPLAKFLGFDLVWFGILFTINLEIGFMTPPFGLNLFYLRGVAPYIPTLTLYRSIIPYCILYLIGMVLVIIWPSIALWLPTKLM